MRRVRLLKAWQDWEEGHVFTEMAPSSSDLLVERGVAEYLDEAVRRAPIDRMMRPVSRAERQKAQA